MQKKWEKTSCTFNRCTAEQVCDCILPFLIRAIYPSKLSTSTVSNIPITVHITHCRYVFCRSQLTKVGLGLLQIDRAHRGSFSFWLSLVKGFYKQFSLKVDGKGCCSIEDETTKNDATEAQQASNSTDGTKCMGCINGHQAAKTKETTSSESSKDIQGSPCSSCGDSCSKCPDCCSYNAENKNNPEAIITSTTGMKY